METKGNVAFHCTDAYTCFPQGSARYQAQTTSPSEAKLCLLPSKLETRDLDLVHNAPLPAQISLLQQDQVLRLDQVSPLALTVKDFCLNWQR